MPQVQVLNDVTARYNTDSMAGGGGGSSTLVGLTDVDISNPTDGQTLTYDATAGKWVNGGGGSSGGVLEVQASFNEQTEYTTLDKTWLEISNAMNDGLTVYIGSTFTDEYDGHEITSVYKYRVNATYVNAIAGELGVTTDCNNSSGYSEFKCSGINDYPNDSYMQQEG